MAIAHLSLLAEAGEGFDLGWLMWAIPIVVVLVVLLIVAQFFSLWLQAFASRAGVTLIDLIGMRLRKVDSRTLVIGKIQLVKAGIHDIGTNDLESHYLARGRVPNVVNAMIAANRANIDLSWQKACAIDLAGRDILDAIHTSVNPKVIDVPSEAGAKATIDAVAKDGIQLKAKARVTVRTNILQLIGGATEETVVARVGEGIVTSIGSAESYGQVLENPDKISKNVLQRGLDAGTAFEILSIDIADVNVGRNIGAELQTDQAEADKRVAQAKAEERRAMAVAAEQENRAHVEAMRAKVVEAEAQVPLAIAEAFKAGNLGVMDYYNLRNIESDTDMRANIARSTEGDERKK